MAEYLKRKHRHRYDICSGVADYAEIPNSWSILISNGS